MKKIFCFYPHCLIKPTNSEILVYDCLTYKSLYVQNVDLHHTDRDSLTKGYIEERDETKSFVSSCLSQNMGYYIEVGEKMPFMNDRKIKFTTSLEKEFRALNYNLPSYTNTLLKSVAILCNNTHESKYSKIAFSQIEYPDVNSNYIDYQSLLNQFRSFPSLERIVVAGELDTPAFYKILSYAKDNGIAVTYRIFLNSANVDMLINNLEQNEFLNIEVLVDRDSDFMKLRQHDRLYIKALIVDLNEINIFENYENVVFVPVLISKVQNNELLQQMIMTKEEILAQKRSKKACLLADYINSGAYGNITINYDLRVSCIGQQIGSIKESDLSYIINNWINNEKSMWYFKRSKKACCSDCALTILCPSINIYEELGIYNRPCKI